MKWISVEDRLPEPLHRDVLMYIPSERDYILVDHGVIMGYKGSGSGWMSHMFDDEFYGGKGGYEDGEVTHWMPLPDPPEVNDG